MPNLYESAAAVASAARTASGNSGALTGYGPATRLRTQLNVTAGSGTDELLDVTIEDSVDGGTTWNTVVTFTQATGVTREVKNLETAFGDTLRVKWVIAGTDTPTFTFAVHIYSE